MAITRSATAKYEGVGKDGAGKLTTQSGVLNDQPYGFNTRFGDERGTNPEELIAAAHAGCFTMALSFALAKAESATRISKHGQRLRSIPMAKDLKCRVRISN